jgi:Tol biopolymer transport system component
MKRPGTVTISASAGGRTGHATVRVFGLDLLYEGAPHGTPEILRVGPEASVPQRILPPGTVAGEPVPSPDGSRIAFVVADYSQATGDIYVVNLDGTGLRRLTDDSELDDSPAWSPDGSRIVFRSYRSGLDGELWIMDAADGGGLRNLTPQRGSAVIDHRRPAWSPDGDRIAFASTAGGTWDIWTMRADGSDWRRLTSSPALDAEPAWSPDGARLVFRGCDAAAGCDLFLVDAAGGTALRVAFAGDERMPAWSPDGQRIAFVHQEPSAPTPRLFTIRPDGTDRRPVPIDASWGAALKPAWLRY